QNQWERYSETFGQPPEEQYMRNYREQLWNQMVNDILVNEFIEDMGITATDQEIIQEIRYNPDPAIYNHPDFQIPDGGGFDQAKYEYFLATDQSGLVQIFEQQARSRIPAAKVNNLVVSTMRVSEEELRQRFIEEEIRMTAEYIIVRPDHFEDTDITISDREITYYYREHESDFFVAETRQLRYVNFDTTPTPEDTALVERDVQEAIERAEAGEDFAELAQEYTETDGSFGTVAKGAISVEYEEALFDENNETDNIIGPVYTDIGVSVFKINRIVKGASDIDSVDAQHILFNYEPSVNTLDNADSKAGYFSSTAEDIGFDEAAEEEGLIIYETPPINRSGFIPGFGAISEIYSFTFNNEIDDGNRPISSSIETPGGFSVFELSRINEQRTKSVDEVRDEISEIIRGEKQLDLAYGLLESVKDDIDGGLPLGEAVEQYNLSLETAESFRFNDYIPTIGRDIKFAAASLGLDSGEISNPFIGNIGAYIIKMIEKDPFNEEVFEQRKAQIKSELISQKRQMAYSDWIMQLRENADIEDSRNQFFR
ncbi:SurA N-terminal domain-containing protein, partial [candidate division KSB1 bacterium]